MADEELSLRPDTLAVLQAFLAEREAAKAAEEKEAEDTSQALKLSEGFGMSQFWYDEATYASLAAEVLRLVEECAEKKKRAAAAAAPAGAPASAADAPVRVRVACLACPSTFKALVARPLPAGVEPFVFEYDTRFGVFGPRFVHYDFNAHATFGSPVAAELPGSFDIIALDPPYLNPDCLAAFAATIDVLKASPDVPIMLCTGAVMLPHAARLLKARPTRFRVGHASHLSNPFALYVNYPVPESLGGVDEEAEAAYAREQAEAAAAGGAGAVSGGAGTASAEK